MLVTCETERVKTVIDPAMDMISFWIYYKFPELNKLGNINLSVSTATLVGTVGTLVRLYFRLIASQTFMCKKNLLEIRMTF